MKKSRFKLGTAEYKAIVEQAALLPKLVRVGKDGQQLSRVVTKYEGGSKYTRTTEPVYVNHQVEMISAYWNEGPAGVHNYIQTVKAIAKRAEEASYDGGKEAAE